MFSIARATIVSVLLLGGCSQTYTPQSHSTNVVPSCEMPQLEHPGLQLLADQTVPPGIILDSGQGGLCDAQNYQVVQDLVIWRVWNSTYEGSKLGKWWSLEKPTGPISLYRAEFNICPKYSPLDMLVRCTLKAGTQVVIGPGQSAQCSEYFTYPQSDTNQLYLANAEQATTNCTTFSGQFSWHEADMKAQ
ncbi:hypothetical protein [Pseudoalteromonas rubra]|uniref:Lipoprotein n=1 Tax=Pseudoalteromonas rubra TaxID=43658 RepID=A0A5S3X6D9_9GAMM|nr:hypothetical protein [Pseudoalteromonas rubra]TMP39604.1 hypothetical protein CWB98_03180 [Pseudoalteromonas rubra]